ncbi:hypothetical protein KIW84_043664 [Lathyrus oleraceus]|uniref:Uncharacterized protein n=1 Tax=Pisum sativum TaxID=3888 RepID=A0A9D4XI26_PEA|nr:hypothetical protein KIW84_043664 [Pisum sativum]
MSQKDKETFKEYVQRWRELASHISTPLEEKEMTKIFLKTMSSFYYERAPGHDIENCYPLKYEVQKLIKSGMVSIEDREPNVKANPLPAHDNAYVNIVDGYPGNFRVFDILRIQRSLVEMHRTLYLISDYEHEHDGDMGNNVNVIIPVFKTPERLVIQFDSSKRYDNRSVSSLVIRLAGPVPYASDKVVPYKFNATMIENGQEVPFPVTNSVLSIVDVVKVTRSGRVFGPVPPKVVEDIMVGKKEDVHVVNPINAPSCQSGESSGLKVKDDDDDEVLLLIKKNEFNVVEQLLQTPSKISVLSLLMDSEAHREAL